MSPEHQEYRPVSGRRKLLIVLLALAITAFVTWAMTRKSGLVRHAAQHPANVANCSAGQTEGCVGSKTVVLVPVAPAAPAASR